MCFVKNNDKRLKNLIFLKKIEKGEESSAC